MVSWRRLLSHIVPIPVARFQSEFSGPMDIRWENGRLSLNSINANYSFAHLHKIMSKALTKCHLDKHSKQDVLLLGMGAGSVVSILRDEWGLSWPIDSVEKDGRIIEVAREFFHIDRFENHRIHQEDAERFMRETDHEWSLIIVDLFIDRKVPQRFLSREFWVLLQSRLRRGGKVIFNHMDDLSGHPLAVHLPIESYDLIRSGENRVLIYRKGDRS